MTHSHLYLATAGSAVLEFNPAALNPFFTLNFACDAFFAHGVSLPTLLLGFGRVLGLAGVHVCPSLELEIYVDPKAVLNTCR